MNYNVLKKIKETYEVTPRSIISQNIRLLLKERKEKVSQLEYILGISLHTAYAYTKERGYTVKPDLFNLFLLAAYYEIDIMELFIERNG